MELGFFRKPEQERPKRSLTGDMLRIELAGPELATLLPAISQLKFQLQALGLRVSGPRAKVRQESFTYPSCPNGINPVVEQCRVHYRTLTCIGLDYKTAEEMVRWDLPGSVRVVVTAHRKT